MSLGRDLTQAHHMALDFLRHGPHTMGPLRTDEEMMAALTFIQLQERGLTVSADLGNGYVQWSLSEGIVQ